MKNARQALWGIIIALAAVLLIMGGVTLSLAEGNALQTTSTLSPSLSPTWHVITLQVFSPVALSPTPPAMVTATPGLPSFLPTETPPTPSLSPTGAIAPATPTRTPSAISTSISTATTLKTPTPAAPTLSRTPTACVAPADWVIYTVKRGDTLYKLSQIYDISVAKLQSANCMGNSVILQVGQKLFVPPGATSVPALPTQTAPPNTPTAPVITSIP